MMLNERGMQAIPLDLREEITLLSELLPNGKPLSYSVAKVLVMSWARIGEEAVSWSGAKLVIKVDPEPYESGDPAYGPTPIQTGNRSIGLWQPFPSDQWRGHVRDMSLFDLAIYLKVKVGTWGTTPMARRRHVTRDRLDGLGLGCRINPAVSTATLYLTGDRSLLDVVEADLTDQLTSFSP